MEINVKGAETKWIWLLILRISTQIANIYQYRVYYYYIHMILMLTACYYGNVINIVGILPIKISIRNWHFEL